MCDNCKCCCSHDFEVAFCDCKRCKKCGKIEYGNSCMNYGSTNTYNPPLKTIIYSGGTCMINVPETGYGMNCN